MSDALLERALAAIEALEGRLEQARSAAREPIAVVGLGCRFPGADDPQAFLRQLRAGHDAVGPVPPARAAAFAAAPPALRVGGFFDDVTGIDAAFFGLSPQEAQAMDPQQRLLLEVCWQALDAAGGTGGALAGTNTGVWVGLGAQSGEYAWRQLDAPGGPGRHAIAGSFHSLMPGRLSYLLDLRGPSLVVDAACASGLVAVHQACEALRHGECDTAVAAGVNLVLSPRVSAAVAASGLWSASGRCRAFDAEADGFVRGEGAVALVLMRQSDARRLGLRIHALLLGSACGQDGRSNGLTAPSGPAQAAVLRAALDRAGLEPTQVGYVEAHATGTRLGDAIEAQALAEVYGAGRSRPLAVGALKPALGHLEAASGLAALIKSVLAVEHGVLPATLHHAQLGADVAALAGQIEVVTRARDWTDTRRIAGVSAFGMSGTNAHVLVASADPPVSCPKVDEDAVAEPATLRLSAASEVALRQWAAQLAHSPLPDWQTLCEAIIHGRKAFPLAATLTATNLREGRALLQALAAGQLAPSLQPLPPPGARHAWTRVALPPYPYDRHPMWLDPAGEAIELAAPSWVPVGAAAASPLLTPVLLGGDGALLQECRAAVAAAGGSVGDLPSPHAEPGLLPATARWVWCLPAAAAEATTDLLATLLALLKARATHSEPQAQESGLLLVTPPSDRSPAAAAAGALWRVAALEHPELGLRHLEVEPSVALPMLAAQLLSDKGAPWSRLAADGRLLSPARITLDAPPAHAWQPRAGCWLVTGAFGGVGTVLAGWLVERGVRELLLAGRQVRPPAQLNAWTAAGARVRLLQADVADAAAMAQALADLDADGVPLAGVLHAAGATADGLLMHTQPSRLDTVLRPKLDGAVVLDRLTRGRGLQAFVLFGSVTTRITLAGTGPYAAANAALEALAAERARAGEAALCVHWGTWQGAGMAAASDAAAAAQWELHGIFPFTAAQGLDALGRLLASGVDCAIAGRLDWAAAARQQARAEGRCVAAAAPAVAGTMALATSLSAPAVVAPTELDSKALQRIVTEEVAAILRRQVGDPMLALSFGELGLGSLAAVELKTRLGHRLGVPVPATLAFNHPSVAAAAAFLARRLRTGALPPQPPVGGPVDSIP